MDGLPIQVVAMPKDAFDLGRFLIAIAPTAIGSLLGFLSGWAVSAIKNGYDARQKAFAEEERRVSTLKDIALVCAGNIEFLVGLKRQFLRQLAADAAIVAQNGMHNVANGVLQKFYMTIPVVHNTELPPRQEYRFAATDVPYLYAMARSYQGAVNSLDRTIVARNEALRDYATRPALQLPPEVVAYYQGILVTTAQGALVLCDDALMFAKLINDQVAEYAKHFGETLPPYVLKPEAQALMPPEEHLGEHRGRLKRFELRPRKRRPRSS